MLALAALFLVVAALSIWLARLAHTDGGPHRAQRPPEEHRWYCDNLPARPYVERIQA